jgi:glutaredoxin-related protein
MGLTVYGMKACPDCVEAVEELDGKGIGYVYKEFSEDTGNLKEFLKYRDSGDIFDRIKEEGKIGIPCFVLPDGTLTLSLEDVCVYFENEK